MKISEIPGRYRISISYGTMSAVFTRDRLTILEAKEVGYEMSRVLFQIEDVENVVMHIKEKARYEPQKGMERSLFND